jgi:hypothetical protein
LLGIKRVRLDFLSPDKLTLMQILFQYTFTLTVRVNLVCNVVLFGQILRLFEEPEYMLMMLERDDSLHENSSKGERGMWRHVDPVGDDSR